MAVFLKFQSKRKLNDLPKFHMTVYEYEFLLTAPIVACEWPLLFSEYIVDRITEDTQPNDFLGISITNDDVSDYIPFSSVLKLTPTVFDDHFEKIFYDTEKLSGKLSVEVTKVSVPKCYLQ